MVLKKIQDTILPHPKILLGNWKNPIIFLKMHPFTSHPSSMHTTNTCQVTPRCQFIKKIQGQMDPLSLKDPQIQGVPSLWGHIWTARNLWHRWAHPLLLDKILLHPIPLRCARLPQHQDLRVCSQLQPQYLEQCLAHTRLAINICRINRKLLPGPTHTPTLRLPLQEGDWWECRCGAEGI